LGLDTYSLKREALALKAFAGFGAVNVLTESDGMLLLERADPGVSLRSYFPEKDNDAIQITCECLKRLHQAAIPTDHHFPHVKDWLMALDKNLSIPTDYLHKARKLRDELIATSATPALLHGDLHHDNILQNSNDWVVIDPKGVIGEPAYEVAAFIRNPIPELLTHDNATSIIENRIAQFAKTLKLSEQRIIHWCYVQAVLAWALALEDNCDETYFKKLTGFLAGTYKLLQ
jgi:streptomycin 6-kinase